MVNKSLLEVDVIVSLCENYISQVSEISEQLSLEGLKDVQIMTSIGIIAGKCDAEKLEKMRKIVGVSAIEVADNIQLAPPGSDIL